jgi:hypothetical protein
MSYNKNIKKPNQLVGQVKRVQPESKGPLVKEHITMVIQAATRDEMRLDYITRNAYWNPNRPEVTVPSTSEKGKTYSVFYSKKTLITTSCDCPATEDCIHRLAIDGQLREHRPSLVKEVLYSEICGHRVKKDVNKSCGCMEW